MVDLGRCDMSLWNALEAAANTGGALCAKGLMPEGELPEESWVAEGLSIDTRTIQPGDIFVAIKDVRDGHDFVRSAFAAGASAALVSRAPKDTPDGKPLLLVPDTLAGLRDLAAAARDRCFGKLIGVTGSAGKTSTKEMLRAALAPSGKVHAAQKSFNNHLGVPLTLAALPKDADFGVFEIGMNHAGEITPLTDLVRPHIAIVTTVAAAHLEFFASVEEIAEAKAEIFSGLRGIGNNMGVAILPKDNPYFDLLANRATQLAAAEIISFGTDAGSRIRMTSYEPQPSGLNTVHVDFDGTPLSFQLGLTGQHQAMNALAVLGAVKAVGGSLDKAIAALEAMQPVEGRGARHQLRIDGRKVTLIDESYNANPASMAVSISGLGAMPIQGKRIAVLGEMRELGESEAALHLDLANALEVAKIDLVFAAGPLMKEMYETLPEAMRGGFAATALDLVAPVKDAALAGDIIMAKGSNASRVGLFVKELIASGT